MTSEPGGPPRQRTDRRQLQQIIAGLTEGVILVDTDQTIVWANEAALGMHGVETIADLGATVGEYRTRFTLRYRNNRSIESGNYPMDRVIAGEIFDEVVVEVTKADEDEPHWVHRIRSLVLTDAAGTPDCLALVLHDATEQFSAEERFERMFAANPAPAVICRLSDRRYVKANQGFLDLTGFARAEVVGRGLAELDVLEHAERHELAVERLDAHQTIPQMETLLVCANGGRKWAIVAGQPIELAEEPCMLFTFMDLDPRKQAESALRQSEERFAKSFRLTPVPTLISARDGFRVLDVNDAFTTVFGHGADEIVGRSTADIGLWEDQATRREFERALTTPGGVRNLDLRARTKDGSVLDCQVSADIVSIGDQDCVLATVQDITERKRSEAELMAAIETVMQDTSWFSRTVIEKLANLREAPGSRRPDAGLAALTGREREVLGLICEGLPDAEIAAALGLSRNTIRNQVAAIYAKTDIHRRPALIVWARERGVTGGPPKPRRTRPDIQKY
jgi:PAS domain S-box-containing protein